jgi:hypothetical protein
MLERVRDLQARAVITVTLEEGDRPSVDAVAEVFGEALGLEPSLFTVSTINSSCFLIELPSPEHRAVALGWNDILHIDIVRHHLMSWTQASQAEPAHLYFKVRICIEGVPPHAQQLATVVTLLPLETLLERADTRCLAAKECNTCFSKENQVQTYMHVRIKFHAYSDI